MLILLLCGLPIILVGGGGLLFTLLKLGVIGKYWLKGEEAPQTDQDYTLDQSNSAE